MRGGKKILVLRLGAMGDILFTTPALRALKAKYPNSHVTYVVMKKWAFLLKRNPCVDRVVGILYRRPRAIRHLARESFDLLINFHEFEDGAQICESLRATERRGNRWVNGRLVTNEHSRWLGKDVVIHQELYRRHVSYAEIHSRIAGVEPDSYRFDFYPSLLARARARWFFARHGLNTPPAPIALHLHSRGSPVKSWSPESALEVVRRLKDRHFLILGYKHDREQTRPFEKEANAIVTYADAATQAAMLRSCALFVGIDSGPRQLASAAGTPILTLFGPTPPEFLPRNSSARELAVSEPCAPCFEEACPTGRKCLDRIEPERIAQAIRETLNLRT